jgi:hypothetical protein
MWLNAETAGGVSVLQRQLFKLVLGQSPAGIGCERAAQIVRRPMSDRLAAVCFRNAIIEANFARGPGGKAFLVPIAKDQIASPFGLLPDNCCGCVR